MYDGHVTADDDKKQLQAMLQALEGRNPEAPELGMMVYVLALALHREIARTDDLRQRLAKLESQPGAAGGGDD